MPARRWGGTSQQPPTLGDIGAFIPPIRVPATFGTYPGPTRNPIGTPAVPSVARVTRSLPNPERRRAVVAQVSRTAEIAVARASYNARKLAGALPRPR